MKRYQLFDILGPIMIGPSSSHTAGAVRLGHLGAKIFNKKVTKVNFYLHGSFASTYKGHGTDKALIAGVMNMQPDDERIIHALEIAKQANIEFQFIEADLGYVHPNTVKMEFFDQDGSTLSVIGSSIGGGNVEIININNVPVRFTGEYPTIILTYYDRHGMVADVSILLTIYKINIATLQVTRENKIATMVIELDQNFPDAFLEKARKLDNVIKVIGVRP